ncbi:FprA family A-type flavoprotein [Acetohalobium arabaticum]|uniref:Flavodoxin/nitric oxide synthase n=1 Tax=Acetohalobium arabaticum (strain ATCC 49924 / DSM 5501 / Z-7288) TaxID=574087 RepID=D9QUD5_ACEAZ|nr:FprA family A-type flavoprotein [Acetohalobium arabaticum]ADL11928.1 flavodoxin/nitric oxide synthase [Acetohalobium arabaticum DSM 5501]
MQPIEIKENIYWVGGIDWNLRNFHGYSTDRGSTYNAYLIIDDQITLVDTVKSNLYDEMIERISKVIDPAEIDYIVSNHVEMDHSGGLPELMEVVEDATVITSPKGEEGLKLHYDGDWDFKAVNPGESLDLGTKSLEFVLTPMVHWPDNMVTYLPEDKILFSNDAFGQHYASSERFDDQTPYDIIMEEAKKYYANIVLPYSSQVQNVLGTVGDLEIETIAPSHGIIWRSNIGEIIQKYKKWSANETEEEAVIIYDTMWESTAKIASGIQKAFEAKGINTKMKKLGVNHISDVMTDVMTAKYICVGSPTLNNNMLPEVAAFLTYLKGLAPKDRIGLAFGSYGWGGQSVSQVADVLEECGFELLGQIKEQYIPDNLEGITKEVKELLRG